MLRIIFIILLYPASIVFLASTEAGQATSTPSLVTSKATQAPDHDHQDGDHKDADSGANAEHQDDHAHNENEDSTHIESKIAQAAGVGYAVAEAGVIERHVQVYGRLVTPPTHQVMVRARFPGLVVSLHANTGDAVRKGALLAVVESNESLRRYEIRAAIDGVIQERLINVSETTTDAPLFILVNQEQLWAELSVFPSQRAAIKPKQAVHIRHNGHDHHAEIMSLVPPSAIAPGTAQPYVIARVVLNNEFHDMAAGDYVLADIDVELVEAAVRIKTSALQELEGQMVVFVHEQELYRAVPVTLGVRDDCYAEVLSGLKVGDEYVVQNSYLIKADLGKRAAEHEH